MDKVDSAAKLLEHLMSGNEAVIDGRTYAMSTENELIVKLYSYDPNSPGTSSVKWGVAVLGGCSLQGFIELSEKWIPFPSDADT